ncbi:MAG: toll/interleukin-1 receptor domain-containing protein [Saprospiraceae bacterium]|nr:toll/interleukin-1 receptor domain-containing protein [Saprospiraceae bacterium]MDW8485122.1 hypothetical protein [Saprospiraceae bacterium]
MWNHKWHVYISFHEADIQTADDFYRYLYHALEGNVVCWNPMEVAEEDYRRKATEFMENQADLFVACLSPYYLDLPNTRWEVDKAVQEYRRRKGALQLLVLLVRDAFIPPILAGFPVTPSPEEPIEGSLISRESQLKRAAARASDLLRGIVRSQRLFPEPEGMPFALTFEDVRERLLVWLRSCDLGPLFELLKQLFHPERTPDELFALEDAFSEWHQQSQHSRLSFEHFQKTMEAIRLDLGHLIHRIEEHRFRENWPTIFALGYYGWAPLPVRPDTPAGLFLPFGEIHIPDMLNLLAQARTNNEAWEGVGTLTLKQQQEFRRHLLLAQDALRAGNYARAHALCEHVRTHLDPQSAQLYEMLLVSFLKKEGPDRIVHDAVYGTGTRLNHVIMYAGRMAEYQHQNKCPCEGGTYNLRATAEALSDALLRLYSTFENDYVLHTGRHRTEVPDNRAAVSRIVQTAMTIYRTIHPYRGFLELAVNEMCNGGKYDYIRRVEIVRDEFRFASHEDFGLESEIREVIGMLEALSHGDDDTLINRQLRENLLFNLRAKRFRLQAQIAEEQRRYVQFTDLRESVLELVDAALLGYKIFGDEGYPDHESFLRFAIEQLLPELLLPVASATPPQAIGNLTWFTLDEHGQLRPHPDCERFRFDVVAVVEKIVRDHAGRAGWMHVRPNLLEAVHQQVVALADQRYADIRKQLEYTDFRRPQPIEARKVIVQCLREWKSAWLALPDRAEPQIQRILLELLGERALMWMQFSPFRLETLPDSVALNYDAVNEMRAALEERPNLLPKEVAFRILNHNLFRRHILPDYQQIPAGDESRRYEVTKLMLEALHQYRDLYADFDLLKFVFDELTLEHKLPWIDITPETGQAVPWSVAMTFGFDPPDILRQIIRQEPERLSSMEARRRIAERRHAEEERRYYREISPVLPENKRPEREIAIGIIRKLKGIFRFYPDPQFLFLAIEELEGRGRIRWNSYFLGFLPLPTNHYENRFYNFDYLAERSELRAYYATAEQWKAHVQAQTAHQPI